ncbi:acyltransferase [Mucilaginibacter sp. CAU 1740]|uniref:acyltransferase family protein n=1 Tax=Mucilaginibacter sp. CAU 1740 TaxID=3140365 RepID=UPI00325C0AAB
MANTSTHIKPHIVQVDYIRAIASMAVALFHLGGKALLVLKYGWLGVQMFFLLSGFIICWAIPRNYTWNMFGKFTGKRILRIEPPYLISIVVALISQYIWNDGYQIDWQNVLTHLAYINNFTGKPYLSPVYWTLGIEFQFYIFIGIFFPLITRRWGILFLPVFSAVPIFVNIPGATLLGFFPLFALGTLYYLYLTGVKQLPEILIFSALIAAIGVYTMGWIPVLTGLFALSLLIMPLRTYPVVSFFSKISFSLYLTHDVIGGDVVVYLGSILPKTIPFKALEFLTGIVASVLFAWVFYRLVELPCLRLSKRIRYKRD